MATIQLHCRAVNGNEDVIAVNPEDPVSLLVALAIKKHLVPPGTCSGSICLTSGGALTQLDSTKSFASQNVANNGERFV